MRQASASATNSSASRTAWEPRPTLGRASRPAPQRRERLLLPTRPDESVFGQHGRQTAQPARPVLGFPRRQVMCVFVHRDAFEPGQLWRRQGLLPGLLRESRPEYRMRIDESHGRGSAIVAPHGVRTVGAQVALCQVRRLDRTQLGIPLVQVFHDGVVGFQHSQERLRRHRRRTRGIAFHDQPADIPVSLGPACLAGKFDDVPGSTAAVRFACRLRSGPLDSVMRGCGSLSDGTRLAGGGRQHCASLEQIEVPSVCTRRTLRFRPAYSTPAVTPAAFRPPGLAVPAIATTLRT